MTNNVIMFGRYHKTFFAIIAVIIIPFIYHSKLSSNDEAVGLGLRQVDLSDDMNGWSTATQSKTIEYGKWTSTMVNNPGGGAWGGVVDFVTTLVWEDSRTVRSNEFRRTSMAGGEKGFTINSIQPFVPNDATNYTQQAVNSYLLSPRIDLSRSSEDHFIFQYKRDAGFNLNVWIGKNDGSLWQSIWDLQQGNSGGNVSIKSLIGGYSEVMIDLDGSIVDLNSRLISNGFPNEVLDPQTNNIYVVIVAQDNASRWIGSIPQTLQIKSIWTPSYYGDENPDAIEIEPMVAINYELDTVTFSGAIGKTYEVQVSKNLKNWNVTHSFTLKEDSETYPISYFIQERPRRSFFRLREQQ